MLTYTLREFESLQQKLRCQRIVHLYFCDYELFALLFLISEILQRSMGKVSNRPGTNIRVVFLRYISPHPFNICIRIIEIFTKIANI